jgi:Protein of unknown function (DUF3467)
MLRTSWEIHMAKKHIPQLPKTNGTDKDMEPAGINFSRATDFKAVYANFARVNFNAFEISVLFGYAGVDPERQEKVSVEMTTRVILDAIEAKLLVQMLSNAIYHYEKKYGEVVIPDDVKLPVDATKMEGV